MGLIVSTPMSLESNPPFAAEPSDDESAASPPCVLVFNANDPSGAGGLNADALAGASVGAHPLTVVTGTYLRDTAEVFDQFALDEDAVTEQARTILEDIRVQVFKVGFCGSPENLSAIAELASDYADVPLVAYMPNLSWWGEDAMEAYLDAYRDLLLPQTTVLVGNHNTLWRWLLPDWEHERSPGPRDIARAASEYGVPNVLVTGIHLPDQHIENALATPQTVLLTERMERFDAVFAGAGDTLSMTLACLLASGTDLEAATHEALSFLDQSLQAGYRPGMGLVLPDRLFWAEPEEEGSEGETDSPLTAEDFSLHQHNTKH